MKYLITLSAIILITSTFLYSQEKKSIIKDVKDYTKSLIKTEKEGIKILNGDPNKMTDSALNNPGYQQRMQNNFDDLQKNTDKLKGHTTQSNNNGNFANTNQSNNIIIKDKAYFYDAPFEKTKTKKFLIKGDSVEIIDRNSGFVKVKNYNNGKINAGWLKEEDIQYQ